MTNTFVLQTAPALRHVGLHFDASTSYFVDWSLIKEYVMSSAGLVKRHLTGRNRHAVAEVAEPHVFGCGYTWCPICASSRYFFAVESVFEEGQQDRYAIATSTWNLPITASYAEIRRTVTIRKAQLRASLSMHAGFVLLDTQISADNSLTVRMVVFSRMKATAKRTPTHADFSVEYLKTPSFDDKLFLRIQLAKAAPWWTPWGEIVGTPNEAAKQAFMESPGKYCFAAQTGYFGTAPYKLHTSVFGTAATPESPRPVVDMRVVREGAFRREGLTWLRESREWNKKHTALTQQTEHPCTAVEDFVPRHSPSCRRLACPHCQMRDRLNAYQRLFRDKMWRSRFGLTTKRGKRVASLVTFTKTYRVPVAKLNNFSRNLGHKSWYVRFRKRFPKLSYVRFVTPIALTDDVLELRVRVVVLIDDRQVPSFEKKLQRVFSTPTHVQIVRGVQSANFLWPYLFSDMGSAQWDVFWPEVGGGLSSDIELLLQQVPRMIPIFRGKWLSNKPKKRRSKRKRRWPRKKVRDETIVNCG